MKATSLIWCVLALALLSVACAPEATLSVSVAEMDDGIVTENTGTADCIAIVTWPEDQQCFRLNIGENVTVPNIS